MNREQESQEELIIVVEMVSEQTGESVFQKVEFGVDILDQLKRMAFLSQKVSQSDSSQETQNASTHLSNDETLKVTSEDSFVLSKADSEYQDPLSFFVKLEAENPLRKRTQKEKGKVEPKEDANEGEWGMHEKILLKLLMNIHGKRWKDMAD